jgi:hypothetical protein
METGFWIVFGVIMFVGFYFAIKNSNDFNKIPTTKEKIKKNQEEISNLIDSIK